MLKTRIGMLALTGMLALASCGTQSPSSITQPPVNATTVSVTFANPNNYTIVVKDSSGNTVSNLAQVAPGTYTVTFSKAGYKTVTRTYTFVEGQNYNLEVPTLEAMSGAFYVNAQGQMVEITQADLNNAGSKFVFYAWLENENNGIWIHNLDQNKDPGQPLPGEQDEVAPTNTQNLAAGWVGYKAADGKVYPVIGASVRWDILEQTGSVRFSAADDGGNSGGVVPQYISDNALTAETFTNRAGNANNARFPSSVQYPLYNVTGVGTPDLNGFTWTALNHDPKYSTATARVRAVAYVNGTEVTKQFLNKTFAPSAKLVISKDPAAQETLINQAKTFSITVKNEGRGPATGIKLNDKLMSGNAAVYGITAPAGTTANTADGFDVTFDLAPGESRTFTFPAQASETGVYCDMATITQYTNGAFGVQNPSDLSDTACLTVRAPKLNIIKEFVDANGNVIADPQTVMTNTDARLRVTVKNGGDATATNVVVTDNLNGGASAAYSVSQLPTGTTANTNDGWAAPAFDLAAGQTRTYLFNVRASADGRYCDTASFTSSNAGTGSDDACLIVATPKLNITKVNNVSNVFPGSSYQSTIVVSNTGNATATDVAVKDLLGQLQGGTAFVNFGSGSYTVTGSSTQGSVAKTGNTITTVPETMNLAAGSSITLVLTSTVPAGAAPGQYCDVGSFTSGNAGNGEARACVEVRPYLAEQIQLVDAADPIVAGGATTTYTGTFINEQRSNESAVRNSFNFVFGSNDPRATLGGAFNFSDIQVYIDPTPVRDPVTGAITSNYTNASSRRLAATEFTTTAASGTGTVRVTLQDTLALPIGGVFYIRTTVGAPAAISAGDYYSTVQWTNFGSVSNNQLNPFSSEPTTVIK
ncbi:phage tail tube protein [Deinococcus misasensis]|uniref:phage tail tube protein n=1 Tax=Deinococcus misasensis TaxID=392413 RepID=UPI00055457F7|nr:phage tail tube protein [Deinococcus misasensis]